MGLTKAGANANNRTNYPLDNPQGGVCKPGDMKSESTSAAKSAEGEIGVNVNAGIEMGAVVKGSHEADGKVDIKTADAYSSSSVTSADPEVMLAKLTNGAAHVCKESTAAARSISAEVGIGMTLKMKGDVSAAAEAIGGVTASHGEIKTSTDDVGGPVEQA